MRNNKKYSTVGVTDSTNQYAYLMASLDATFQSKYVNIAMTKKEEESAQAEPQMTTVESTHVHYHGHSMIVHRRALSRCHPMPTGRD